MSLANNDQVLLIEHMKHPWNCPFHGPHHPGLLCPTPVRSPRSRQCDVFLKDKSDPVTPLLESINISSSPLWKSQSEDSVRPHRGLVSACLVSCRGRTHSPLNSSGFPETPCVLIEPQPSTVLLCQCSSVPSPDQLLRPVLKLQSGDVLHSVRVRMLLDFPNYCLG